MNFKDQVCLITGAGSAAGIGFATAEILGSLGAKIALVATTNRIYERASELEVKGLSAKGYIADLMNRDEVSMAVSDVMADFGKIDVFNEIAHKSHSPTFATQRTFAETHHISVARYQRWIEPDNTAADLLYP